MTQPPVAEPAGPGHPQRRRGGGRPLDGQLTRRLQDMALDILVIEGLDQLTSEVVALRAGAGKASVYRRWPTIDHLIADAVSDYTFPGASTDRGSLRADLLHLMAPWTTAPSHVERALGLLLSRAYTSAVIHQALERAVVIPLGGAVNAAMIRSTRRGQPIAPIRCRVVQRTVQALCWQRYLGALDPWPVEQISWLVDHLLLPSAGSLADAPHASRSAPAQ